MYAFTGPTLTQGQLESAKIVIAYDKTARANPDYGDRRDAYGKWYFLDQLEVAAEQLKRRGVGVTFLPYESGETEHVLGAEVTGAADTIYFNDQPVA